MSEHDPRKAQQQLEKATDFAYDVDIPTGYSTKNLKPGYTERQANISRSNVLIDYRSETEGGYSWADSTAIVEAAPGRYRADIDSGVGDDDEPDYLTVAASVKRDGAIHYFDESHAEKAAALVTSLAAKRLGDHAVQHADRVVKKINDARETFRSE